LPIGGLFALFSLMPYGRMIQQWPLSIASNEVDFYQRWFDRRPLDSTIATTPLPVLELRTGNGKWTYLFEGNQDSMKVQERGSDAAGIELSFDAERPFHGWEKALLRPADDRSVRAGFAKSVAEAVGGIAQECMLVRLTVDGEDRGPHVLLERFTQGTLDRYGLGEGRLVRVSVDDHIAVKGTAEEQRIAENAWARVVAGDATLLDSTGLALCALWRNEEADDEESLLIFDRSRGTFLPIARPGHRLSPAMIAAIDRSQGAISKVLARVEHAEPTLAERAQQVEGQWAVIAGEGRVAAMQLEFLHHERDRLLSAFAELRAADRDGTQGDEQQAARGSELDPWLRPFRGADDTLRITKGVYELDHLVEVPKGMALVIGKSVRLKMGPHASLVVNGPLHVRGTAANPVFVRPAEEAPFGAICVNGNGGTPCMLSGLRMSGGSQLWLSDRYHSAMLSFHDANVTMTGCSIGAAFGEDGMNIKRGEVDIQQCDFRDAQDDIVDLDQVRGRVSGCSFSALQRSDTATIANGDGLDLSGCRVAIINCTFQGARDKGLSVGERSEAYVRSCSFQGNNTGLASKDGSVAYIEAGSFQGNRIALSVFRKKPVFEGGRIQWTGSAMGGNGQDQQKDAHSSVTTIERMDPMIARKFGMDP
jgi:hypothetical protein